MNPGGPGASGIEFVRDNAAAFPLALRRRFDLVGFDPRGVNASSEFRCIDDLDGRAALGPVAGFRGRARRPSWPTTGPTREPAAAATTRPSPTSRRTAVVGDLDRIRAAIGDEQLTYLGFSYGTLIGSLYAERFPDRIRAMVLDGAIDPSLALEAFRADQARAFERSLRRFLADCAEDRDVRLPRRREHDARRSTA